MLPSTEHECAIPTNDTKYKYMNVFCVAYFKELIGNQ